MCRKLGRLQARIAAWELPRRGVFAARVDPNVAPTVGKFPKRRRENLLQHYQPFSAALIAFLHGNCGGTAAARRAARQFTPNGPGNFTPSLSQNRTNLSVHPVVPVHEGCRLPLDYPTHRPSK